MTTIKITDGQPHTHSISVRRLADVEAEGKPFDRPAPGEPILVVVRDDRAKDSLGVWLSPLQGPRGDRGATAGGG